MNIYASFSLFTVIVLIYSVIIELFTILFRFTGLPEDKARFQVISVLTGCGFTTRESEIMLTTRSRRRLMRVTMIFGYVFNITVISAFINVFLSMRMSQAEHTLFGMLIPLSAALAGVVILRIRPIRAWFEARIEGLAGRLMGDTTSNALMPLDYIGQDTIVQITLRKVPDALAGVPLSQTGLKSEQGILVMLVEHPGGKTEPADGSTVFAEGDRLTVFGDYRTVCRIFDAREYFIVR